MARAGSTYVLQKSKIFCAAKSNKKAGVFAGLSINDLCGIELGHVLQLLRRECHFALRSIPAKMYQTQLE